MLISTLVPFCNSCITTKHNWQEKSLTKVESINDSPNPKLFYLANIPQHVAILHQPKVLGISDLRKRSKNWVFFRQT